MTSKTWADDLATCETVREVVLTICFWASVREEGGTAFRRAAEARILELTAPHEMEMKIKHARAWLNAAHDAGDDCYCVVCGHYGETSHWEKLTGHGTEYECPGCGVTHALPVFLPDEIAPEELLKYEFAHERDRAKCWEEAIQKEASNGQ
jgi:hypothetical protein